MAEATVARGRKAIELSADEFQLAVTTLENTQPDGKFANRSQLWQVLESTEWAKSRQPRPLTAQVAMIKAKTFGTLIQTPVGQRGRQKGQGPVNVVSRKRKPMADAILTDLRLGIPVSEDGKNIREKYEPVAKRAASGSLKAAIKLKCLDCCAWKQKEVALCTVTDCSLWNFRPYKNKESLTVDGRKRISLGLLDEVTSDESDSE